MTPSPYPVTWYSRALGPAEPRAAMRGDLETEICVVGGGLAGLTTALELARAGRRVIVLEAQRIGWGASGRNGGFVGSGWSRSFDSIALAVGQGRAGELQALSQEGVGMVRSNIAALAMPGVQPVYGKISAARSDSAEAFKARAARMREQFGETVDYWDRDRLQAVLRSDRYHQGLYLPNDFQIDPLAYARGLAVEIEHLGGLVFEGSAVIDVDSIRGERRVQCAGGAVTARDVVIACGGYTGPWARRLRAAYVPIATYVMLTQADPALISTAIRTTAAVGDQRRAGDYYRLVEGGERILWGGRITTRVTEPRRLAAMLHRTMTATYPQLSDLRVDYAWSGLMSYARHLMPQIGPLEDGLWSCTAFGGHGLNTTAIGGRVIAEAILARTDRWKLFSPFGLTWNGGPAGRVAVQATYWWLQLQDWLTEAAADRRLPPERGAA